MRFIYRRFCFGFDLVWHDGIHCVFGIWYFGISCDGIYRAFDLGMSMTHSVFGSDGAEIVDLGRSGCGCS